MEEKSPAIKPAAVGQGFFTESGSLKPKEKLADKVETVTESAASSSDVVGKAISRVDERFRAEVSSAADDINTKSEQVKSVRKNLKAEKEQLQELKQAFQDGDDEKAKKLSQAILETRAEREKISKEVSESQRGTPDRQSIRLGNKEQGSVAVPKIKVPEAPRELPSNAKEAKAQLEQVNEDLKQVQGDREKIQDSRKELSDVLSSGRQELDQISRSSVSSIDDAEKLSNDIASSTRGLTRDQLLSSVAGKLDPGSISAALKF